MFPKRICSCLLLVLIILLASILVLETAHSLQSSRLDRLSPISIEDDYDDNTAFKINSKWKSLLRQTSHGHDRIKAPKDPIMGKMTNATLKAELGRSAWRVLHVMAGKFPDHPTPSESKSLSDFIYLFAQLYPCGDCAKHFQRILSKHPPNVTSKAGVSLWACQVHNLVNERLEKPQFDCAKVSEVWKCGCADDEVGAAAVKTNGTST